MIFHGNPNFLSRTALGVSSLYRSVFVLNYALAGHSVVQLAGVMAV